MPGILSYLPDGRRWLTIFGGAVAAISSFGCTQPGTLEIHLSPEVRIPPRSAVIFLVDGLDVGVVDAMLAAGELPNIDERFVRGGVRVEHAIASMPSNTYPNTVSLLTGQFPGHHGILGNRWFDRHTGKLEHYTSAGTFRNANEHFDDATLFEMLDGRLTVAVQLHTRRGASVSIDRSLTGGYRWLLGSYESFDRRPAKYLTRIAEVANREGRWPSLIVNYFPGVDEIGHRRGPDSDEYRAAVRNVDDQIGRIFATLEHSRLAHSTYFVLISDHRHVTHDPEIFLNVSEWLRENHPLNVMTGDVRDPSAEIDAVVLNGAFRRCAIHLRGPAGWHEPPDPTLVADIANEDLTRHPAVDLVAFRESTDSVRIVSTAGSALVERRSDSGGAKEYRLILERGDPLDISDHPALRAFVADGWHFSREWLAATAASRYPDFVPQIVEMFDSHRAGDVVLFAGDRGTFELNGKGGHGSCLAADMKVPMFFSGPDLPRGGRIEYARSLDLAPTILDLLGEPRSPDAAKIDGVSIAEPLMNAETIAP